MTRTVRLPCCAWPAVLVNKAAVVAVLPDVSVGVTLITELPSDLVVEESLDAVLPRRRATEQPRAQRRVLDEEGEGDASWVVGAARHVPPDLLARSPGLR